MSVELNQISKHYGAQKALDQISFSANNGEIIGLLGPNGAGKTTTMKILTCFMPPSEGEAHVCGYNVQKNPIEVRKNIGYLPEHNPLYKDMYVKEYLRCIARIFKINNPKKKIEELIEMTGLGVESHKKIEFLSKGYRQRVGLAQAMMNDPKVLILDEPTSGLDPNQLVDIRLLIKELGKEKLVIFSSHIMQEVQALCDRVVILNKGQIVEDDQMVALTSKHASSALKIRFKNKVDASQLEKIPGIIEVVGSNKEFVVRFDGDDVVAERIFDFAVNKDNKLLSIALEDSSIETIFQNITK